MISLLPHFTAHSSSPLEEKNTLWRKEWIIPGVILLLALVLRVIALQDFAKLPFLTSPQNDERVYHEVAQQIAAGNLIGGQAALRMSPLYFYFCAGIYSLFEAGLWAIRYVHIILGLFTILLVFDTARILFGRNGAILAGLMAAFYGPFIYFEMTLLSETLAVTLQTLLLWYTVRMIARGKLGMGSLAVCGFIWGLCTLTRPNALLLGIPFAVIPFFIPCPSGNRRRFLQAGIFLVVGVLAIAPLTIRNWVMTGEFLLITDHGGLNFYIGNGPGATGTFRIPQEVPHSDDPQNQVDLFHAAAEKETGRNLSFAQADRFWYGKTLSSIAEAPIPWLALVLKKLAMYWSGQELPINYSYEFMRENNRILAWPLVQFLWVSPLALIGTILMLAGADRRRLAVGLINATLCLQVVLFFMVDRYRLPAVPGLILAAIVPLSLGITQIRQRQWGAFLILVIGLIWALLFAWPRGFSTGNHIQYSNLGKTYLQEKMFSQAEQAFGKSLSIKDTYIPSHIGMAMIHMARQRTTQATQSWLRVYRLAVTQKDSRFEEIALSELRSLGMKTPELEK